LPIEFANTAALVAPFSLLEEEGKLVAIASAEIENLTCTGVSIARNKKFES
jgi:hypothetical protein